MSFVNKPMAKKASSDPLPPRVVRLLRESAGIALLGVALYLVLILYGYNRADPGWSHSGEIPAQNPGGLAGAWLADLLLYLLGVSAWWWVVFFLFLVSWTYHRIDGGIFDRRPLFVSVAGFLVLLLASSGLEALRFYTLKIVLPQTPGGVLGLLISKNLSQTLGFTGATLALLIECNWLQPVYRFVVVTLRRASRRVDRGSFPVYPARLGGLARPPCRRGLCNQA
jgi:S-DNA-T family DNA segregation ATPase FtsK/SpoIIIE